MRFDNNTGDRNSIYVDELSIGMIWGCNRNGVVITTVVALVIAVLMTDVLSFL